MKSGNKGEAIEYFNRVAGLYDGDDISRQPRTTYEPVLKKLDGLRFESVLDIGFGTGELLSMIRQRGNVRLAGIDISREMVHVARKKLGDDYALVIADSEAIPWADDTFDVVISTYSFHHYPRPKRSALEIRRVLKPTGKLVLSDNYAPFPVRQITNLILPYLNEGDHHVYSIPEIDRLLCECGFTSIRSEMVNKKAYILTAEVNKPINFFP